MTELDRELMARQVRLVRLKYAMRTAMAAAGALALVMLGLVLASVNRTTAQILSCTEQTGACYKSNTQRTGQVVTTINEITIIAVACGRAEPNDTPSEVEACVSAEYTRRHPK